MSVHRVVKPVKMEVDESLILNEDAYPITVTLKKGDEPLVNGVDESGSRPDEESVVKCKYMIGCDGAHSWVREKLGIVMEGSQTESVWGVMDIIPITNFREYPVFEFPSLLAVLFF